MVAGHVQHGMLLQQRVTPPSVRAKGSLRPMLVWQAIVLPAVQETSGLKPGHSKEHSHEAIMRYLPVWRGRSPAGCQDA